MVSNYAKFGLRGSAELVRKFGTATGIGFMAGERSRISVVDIDTRNETVLADALDRHGQTPIIARTGSGKFHAYYRHNGEHRMIRPEGDRPIDILGGGIVIAPPSRGLTGNYQFIAGGLASTGFRSCKTRRGRGNRGRPLKAAKDKQSSRESAITGYSSFACGPLIAATILMLCAMWRGPKTRSFCLHWGMKK